jgi:hypothetical protein
MMIKATQLLRRLCSLDQGNSYDEKTNLNIDFKHIIS